MFKYHLSKKLAFGLLMVLVLSSLASVALASDVLDGLVKPPGFLKIKTGSEALDLFVFGRIGTSSVIMDTEETALYPDDPHLNLVDQYV